MCSLVYCIFCIYLVLTTVVSEEHILIYQLNARIFHLNFLLKMFHYNEQVQTRQAKYYSDARVNILYTRTTVLL